MTASAAPATRIARTWLVVLIAGGLLLVVGAVVGWTAVRGAFSAPVLITPGTVSEHAHAGEYLLYAQSGSVHGGFGVTTSDSYEPQLTASELTVTEDGSPLALEPYTSHMSQTETRGSRTYLAVARVQVPHSGRLSLAVGDDEGRVILGPSLGGTIGRAVPGAVLGLVGVVLVVVALVIRSRAVAKVGPQWRLGPAGYGYQPPGWTPPPASVWPSPPPWAPPPPPPPPPWAPPPPPA